MTKKKIAFDVVNPDAAGIDVGSCFHFCSHWAGKGKKTDVKDCQWIQKLHKLGLLTGRFSS